MSGVGKGWFFRLEQSIDAPSLHQIDAHESYEGERTFDSLLRGLCQPQQQESDEGDCDLNADRVLGGAEKTGDLEVLLDPAEEKFDRPASFVEIGDLLRIDGVNAARAVQAVLSVVPLDTFVDDSARRMEIVGSPSEIPAVQQEVQAEIDKAEGKSWPMTSIERMEFYEHAKKAYCVIATGERRFYGCFIFRKGVIAP